MRKILTAIGNPMLNKKIKNLDDYKVVTDDITNDEELIEWLEREKDIDILFLCSAIIKNYTVDEFIRIIKKIQENIFVVFFKGENIETRLKENEHLKIYNTFDMDFKSFEKILQKKTNKNIRKYTSKVIAVSGPNGIRQKHVFHISCKKCGRRKNENIAN